MRSASLYFYSSLLTGIFFLMTASVWAYFANLVLALPALLISYLLWRAGKKHDPRVARYRIIPIVWMAGGLLSLGVLVALLINN